MARHKSVDKRHRQSLKANLKNRAIRSELKTMTKQVTTTSGKPDATAQLSKLTSLLDKAVKRNILHKNTAARKKSRIARLLNKKTATK